LYIFNIFSSKISINKLEKYMIPEDKDPIETSEWLDAINSVIEEEGIERASFIMTKLAKKAQ
jgi:pyruvate dehydrogenase complex dehydrogenase (E1) component